MAIETRALTVKHEEKYPEGWRYYLLEQHQDGHDWHVIGGPQRAIANPGSYSQLHSIQRDGEGRFNNLSGGKPDLNPHFERALERSLGIHVISWEEVHAAIERVKRFAPELVAAYEWFTKRTKPCKLDRLAEVLHVETRTLYTMRDRAIQAFWEELPPDKRRLARKARGTA
jgi:hypothetical protein